jgi:chaperonin GroES
MEKFQPIYNRVLLKRIDGGSTTKSGMIVPESAKEKPTECEVVAVGATYTNEFNTVMSCPVSVGDHVLIGKYSGSNEIKLNGQEYVSVKWDELIGVKSVQLEDSCKHCGRKAANHSITGMCHTPDGETYYESKESV